MGEVIHFRTTAELKAILKARAAAEDRSMASYIKHLILEDDRKKRATQ